MNCTCVRPQPASTGGYCWFCAHPIDTDVSTPTPTTAGAVPVPSAAGAAYAPVSPAAFTDDELARIRATFGRVRT